MTKNEKLCDGKEEESLKIQIFPHFLLVLLNKIKKNGQSIHKMKKGK